MYNIKTAMESAVTTNVLHKDTKYTVFDEFSSKYKPKTETKLQRNIDISPITANISNCDLTNRERQNEYHNRTLRHENLSILRDNLRGNTASDPDSKLVHVSEQTLKQEKCQEIINDKICNTPTSTGKSSHITTKICKKIKSQNVKGTDEQT